VRSSAITVSSAGTTSPGARRSLSIGICTRTDRWESGPVRLHCAFRFEMQHLLERTGFGSEAVYGDFFRHELQHESSEMVWVAKYQPWHE
jgi:hypothetical protein